MVRKVLIVEDEDSIVMSLGRMLKMQKCEVVTAKNAEDAWEIFQKEKPDSCSIDLHLKYSALDGINLLKKIREVDQKVLCIAFTRIINERELVEIKSAGIDKIFSKPPKDEKELKEMVKLLATGRRQGGEK